jgi:hypothetical protein
MGTYQLVMQIDKPITLPPDGRTELVVSDEIEGRDFMPYLPVGAMALVVAAFGGLLLAIGGVWAALRLRRNISSMANPTQPTPDG